MYFEKENRALLEFFEDLKQKQILVEKPNSSLEAFLRLLSFSASDFLTPSEIKEISKETSFSKFLFFIFYPFFYFSNRFRKTSWSFKEKRLFVWVVFHYTELTRRKLSEIVYFFHNGF